MHLILPRIQNMVDIYMELSQWLMSFLVKRFPIQTQEQESILKTKNRQRSTQTESLRNLYNKRYIHLLQIMFGVLIYQICNYFVFRFILFVIDIYSKYENVIKITNAFRKSLDVSRHKQNKIWVDKGSEVYIKSMKPWLEDNSTEINLTDNKGKSVVAEKCIRTLKDTIYKYMTYKYMTYNT